MAAVVAHSLYFKVLSVLALLKNNKRLKRIILITLALVGSI